MRKLAAALALTLLALIGCGGDDDAADDATIESDQGADAPEDTADADEAGDDEAAAGDDGAESDTEDAADGGDSCSLLTPDQIGEVLGVAVDDGTDTVGSCEYEAADGNTFVSIELIDQGRYVEREAGEGVEPVDSIGDAAFADTSTGFVYVSAGGTYFRVNVTGTGIPSSAALDRSKELAGLVVAQL